MGCHGLRAAFALEQGLGLLLDFLFPLAHLHWVPAMRLADLVDCHDPSPRLQADLGFELRQVHVALFRFTHGFPISSDSVQLKPLS